MVDMQTTAAFSSTLFYTPFTVIENVSSGFAPLGFVQFDKEIIRATQPFIILFQTMINKGDIITNGYTGNLISL